MEIYRIICKSTNKIYIGSTVFTKEDRFYGSDRNGNGSSHIGCMKQNNPSPLYVDMRKFGINDFELNTIEILPDGTDEHDLRVREDYWVKYYWKLLGKDMMYNQVNGSTIFCEQFREPGVQEKANATKIARYGSVTGFMNTPKVIQKRINTNISKYGSPFGAAHTDESRERRRLNYNCSVCLIYRGKLYHGYGELLNILTTEGYDLTYKQISNWIRYNLPGCVVNTKYPELNNLVHKATYEEFLKLGGNDKYMLITMKTLWDKYALDPEAVGFSPTNKSIKVYGCDPITGSVSKVRVIRLLRQPYTKLLKVTLADNKSFIGDEYHQLYINNKIIPLKDLKVGDDFPVSNNRITTEYVKVVSIDPAFSDDKYVYDIELEENHLFVHSNGVITHNCCRLRSDSTKMKQFFNSFGSGGVKIGSHRVCTINLPRLAHNSANLEDFLVKLDNKMCLAHDILKCHRDTLQKEIDHGLLPLYSLGFMDLKTQFSTIGIIGFYEAMNILGYDLVEDEGLKVAKKVIDLMNAKNDEFSENDKVLYNLEQIPGESAAIKLAQKDHLVYDGEMNYSMYSNQFIPLVKNVPLAKRIKAQGIFDAAMSGGSILHINIAEKINSLDMLMTLMEYAVENNVVYFAPNYNMAICENGHVTVGKIDTCPTCGGKIVDNMTRVVGFYTSTSKWKEERRGEVDYKSRKWY